MFRKKLRYENEDFSMIGFIIFTLLILIGLLTNNTIIETPSNTNSTNVCILVFYLFVCCIFLFNAKQAFSNRKKYNNIKKNGIKVKGTIVSSQITTTRYNTSDGIEHTFQHYVLVSFINPKTQTEETIKTENLNFHPDILTCNECNVYILENDVYVSDFK